MEETTAQPVEGLLPFTKLRRTKGFPEYFDLMQKIFTPAVLRQGPPWRFPNPLPPLLQEMVPEG
ncbi:hypothetical protein MASR2M79_25100 [Aminivibrio sp.]